MRKHRKNLSGKSQVARSNKYNRALFSVISILIHVFNLILKPGKIIKSRRCPTQEIADPLLLSELKGSQGVLKCNLTLPQWYITI